MKRIFSTGRCASLTAIGIALALTGTTYATGLSESSGRSSAASARDAGAATYSVLGRSFAYYYGDDIPLRTLAETRYSQVNLMSTGAGANGGTITLSQPGQIHVTASVVLVRRPGTGGAATCDLRMNGVGISSPPRRLRRRPRPRRRTGMADGVGAAHRIAGRTSTRASRMNGRW
jgi:hypothetical protein